MNNILVSLKRFFTNKNTVTILGVVGIVLVLFFGYSYRIKQQTNPIRVPYAKQEIQPRTQVTEDMIGWLEIPRTMYNKISNNAITLKNDIVGKYAAYNTVIPAGSLFYRSTLLNWSEMPDSAWADIPDKYTVVSLNVNTETTYGNSIFPGNYIDLYYQTYDETGKLIYGKFIESIEVLAVKDSSGKHVFENSQAGLVPASLIFAVPEDMYLLLKDTQYLSGQLVPVPRNKSYSENPSPTIIYSDYIQDYILSQTVILPEQGSTNNGRVGTVDTVE